MKANIEIKEVMIAAIQHLAFDGFKRVDGEFDWKEEGWIYSAYKVSQPVELIRIDIRKKERTKEAL